MPWASTGWTNNRNVSQMLEFLTMRGQVAISGRVGRERLWDIPERVYPADVVIPPIEEADRIRNARRLVSLGIAGPGGDSLWMFISAAADRRRSTAATTSA